tara:strand:+ start:30 stop:281 length:252 start_codon:yes stop_codon:yes gene_type:complete
VINKILRIRTDQKKLSLIGKKRIRSSFNPKDDEIVFKVIFDQLSTKKEYENLLLRKSKNSNRKKTINEIRYLKNILKFFFNNE